MQQIFNVNSLILYCRCCSSVYYDCYAFGFAADLWHSAGLMALLWRMRSRTEKGWPQKCLISLWPLAMRNNYQCFPQKCTLEASLFSKIHQNARRRSHRDSPHHPAIIRHSESPGLSPPSPELSDITTTSSCRPTTTVEEASAASSATLLIVLLF
jgi:hypothetical protein